MKIFTVFSIDLFVASTFATPRPNGGLARRLERRSAAQEGRTTNPLKVIGLTAAATDVNATEIEYSSNWAGAVLTSPPAGETFNYVSAQFVVPTPAVPQGGGSGKYSAAIWVGIDGDTYGNAVWQSGIDISVSGSQVSLDAWYEWYPSPSYDIQGFAVGAGDAIIITVSCSSNSEGSVTLENIGTGQYVTQSASAPSIDAVLGGQNVEWIVEDFDIGGSQVLFADFGTVLFTDAEASTSSQSVGTDGAAIIEIKDANGNILTDVSLPSSSEVKIVYE
jgi:hypothetical protein